MAAFTCQLPALLDHRNITRLRISSYAEVVFTCKSPALLGHRIITRSRISSCAEGVVRL